MEAEGECLISDQPSDGNLRSPVATRGNVRYVVDFHDGCTIRLDVGKVFGILPGFVNHVPVSWIRLGKEIPSARIGEPISERQWGEAGLSSLKERLALVFILQLVLGSPGNVVMS